MVRDPLDMVCISFVYTEQEIAEKFFRTLSSHGKRPDPASRAALHRTRVRSAVMTPSRKQRQEREAQNMYQQMSRQDNMWSVCLWYCIEPAQQALLVITTVLLSL